MLGRPNKESGVWILEPELADSTATHSVPLAIEMMPPCEETQRLLRRAIISMDARANEDIDAWAEQLADDVCDATD